MTWRSVLAVAIALACPAARAEEGAADRARSSSDRIMVSLAMLPSHGVAGAVSAALPAPLTRETIAAALPPEAQDALLAALPIRPDVLAASLPPPPTTVILDPGYYGSVTLDHAAHLARKVSCKRCHGPGQVHKIGRLAPADAHGRCRGCHEEVAKGPTECRGCHVAPPPSSMLATTTAPEPPTTAGPGAGARGGAAIGAPLGTASTAAALATPVEPPFDPGLSLRKSVDLGFSMVSSAGQGSLAGMMVGVTLREDGYVASQSLEWAGGGALRTLGLIGGGVAFPLGGAVHAELLGVGGFDASNALFVNLVPALGARIGFEWFVGRAWMKSARFSVTAVGDVWPHRAVAGEQVGRLAVSACLGTGFELGSR